MGCTALILAALLLAASPALASDLSPPWWVPWNGLHGLVVIVLACLLPPAPAPPFPTARKSVSVEERDLTATSSATLPTTISTSPLGADIHQLTPPLLAPVWCAVDPGRRWATYSLFRAALERDPCLNVSALEAAAPPRHFAAAYAFNITLLQCEDTPGESRLVGVPPVLWGMRCSLPAAARTMHDTRTWARAWPVLRPPPPWGMPGLPRPQMPSWQAWPLS